MKRQQPLENHFIICGLGHVGYRIAELLSLIGETFVVITVDARPEWHAGIKEQAAQFIVGDARLAMHLEAAKVRDARAVMVVTNDDLINISICLEIQRVSAKTPIIVRIFERFLAKRAERELKVRRVLSPGLLTAPVFVAAAQGGGLMLAFDVKGSRTNVVQLVMDERIEEQAASVSQFCSRRDLVPLSLVSRDSIKSPIDETHLLKTGDALIAVAGNDGTIRLRREGLLPLRATPVGDGSLLNRLKQAIFGPEGAVRALADIWRRSSGVLRFAFVALNGLFIASVAVFHQYLPGRPSWIDSIYFTVTMMTTVGFGDFSLKDAPWWLKLFGCAIMIAGAALVAIVFSLVTDYIVSARVDQALGRRKTPLQDHIVVVGLGDVGTRVAEELVRAGESVIAIERDPDHESIPGLQDKMQVVIGDANRESAMHQANVSQASVVIVTTTNDLTSLRIAHEAEALNPLVRTIVRIYDSRLAGKLGSGLGITRTVNAAQTAASTFVASALADGVEQSFVLGQRLFAIRRTDSVEEHEESNSTPVPEIDLVIQEFDPETHQWKAPDLGDGSSAD